MLLVYKLESGVETVEGHCEEAENEQAFCY